jgi:hypothetical protein
MLILNCATVDEPCVDPVRHHIQSGAWLHKNLHSQPLSRVALFPRCSCHYVASFVALGVFVSWVLNWALNLQFRRAQSLPKFSLFRRESVILLSYSDQLSVAIWDRSATTSIISVSKLAPLSLNHMDLPRRLQSDINAIREAQTTTVS